MVFHPPTPAQDCSYVQAGDVSSPLFFILRFTKVKRDISAVKSNHYKKTTDLISLKGMRKLRSFSPHVTQNSPMVSRSDESGSQYEACCVKGHFTYDSAQLIL